MSENLPLITRYRPTDFAEVVGHEQAMAGLRRAIQGTSTPHSYLFTGPSGVGKTTLARILARELQAEIHEIDAASNNGVDQMRELIDFSKHMAFTETGRRLAIVDECHMLSRNAWNAILKLLEDPPDHFYMALCTTERSRVLETVLTRCYEVALRPLDNAEMTDLLEAVADLEGWKVHADVMELVLDAATGQPRKGLTILQAVHDAPSREEAKRIVTLVDSGDPALEIIRHLVSGKKSWKIVSELLAKVQLEDAALEQAMIGGCRYISAAMLKTTDEKAAAALWQLLEAMVFPASSYDKKTVFIAAIGRCLWG